MAVGDRGGEEAQLGPTWIVAVKVLFMLAALKTHEVPHWELAP